MNENSMKGKRVVVTGGAGVIGRELLSLLEAKGADVLSVDRCPLPRDEGRGVRHLLKDLDEDALDELSDFCPSIVFHLAAAFERSTESPEFSAANWRDNVLVTHRLVELIRQTPSVTTFVFASSYLVYSPTLYLSTKGAADSVFLEEDARVRPRNLCGAAKYYAESEIDSMRVAIDRQLRTIHARIFRVYGRGSKDVISRWVRAAAAGADIEAYNTQNQFDFIFAGDVAEGLLRLAEAGVAEGAVNIGSGVSRSIDEVLDQLQRSGFEPPRIQRVASDELIESSRADVTRLKKLTGWAPTVDLREGMRLVLDYEQRRRGAAATA